jgi:NAD(P)H-flavin reductase
MILFWGAGTREGLYEIDEITDWSRRGDRFSCVLAIERGPLPELQAERFEVVQGSLADAIDRTTAVLPGRDAYLAGPPAMMPAVTAALRNKGLEQRRLTVDSFGL